jgi:hypothetical protein
MKLTKCEVAFPSGYSILFNETFKFEQGFLEKDVSDGLQKECLQSLESLCVFCYREFYKNLLCILVEMQSQIFKYTPVPKRMMEMFGVSNAQLVAHMMRRGKFETTKFSQAYRMDIKNSRLIVGNSVTRPVQFALGALPSDATFTDKLAYL